MILTVMLYVLVNFLLIKGVAGLLRVFVDIKTLLLSSLIAGVYVFACLVSKSEIISSIPIYILSVLLTGFISFGATKRCWIGMFSFVLLYLSLGGLCIGKHEIVSLVIGTIGILLTSYISSLQKKYTQVKFHYNCRDYAVTALRDTGNQLKDPVSGCPVMIVESTLAQQMTGLTVQQLRSPIDSIKDLPGARLIPYKTIGQSGVFLLGIYIPVLKIGSWQGRGVIAFSPENFEGTYQALTGGVV